MSIYTIDRDILALVDPETGEIADWDAFDALQMEREKKIENTACFYKNTMAEAAAIKAEEESLKKRRTVLENQGARLKKYLEYATNGEKFQTAKCAITWRKTPPKVELTEPALAIAWAMSHGRRDLIIEKPPEISKNGLAEVLKSGEEIPGAALVSGQTMGVK